MGHTKCGYRLFGPVSNVVRIEDLRARQSDFTGPNNAPGLVSAGRFEDVLAGIPRSHPFWPFAALMVADRLCPSVDPPIVRVAGNVRCRTQGGEFVQPALPPAPTQFSRCPHLKLGIATTGSTLDRVIIDCDSAIDIPAEHVCVELLGPVDWFDPTTDPGLSSGGPAWDVQGVVRICRVPDSVEVFGRLTEFESVAPGTSITKVIPRGARRVWFFGLPVLQVWQMFAGDPAAGGVLVGAIRVPADTVEAVEFLPGVSHLRNLVFASTADVGFCWEIQPL